MCGTPGSHELAKPVFTASSGAVGDWHVTGTASVILNSRLMSYVDHRFDLSFTRQDGRESPSLTGIMDLGHDETFQTCINRLQ